MALASTSQRRRIARAIFVRSLVIAASLFVAGSFQQFARAQDLILPPQPAPPPMRYIPDAERAQLAAAVDPRLRVRASLDLLEDRIARAERETAATHYDAATAHLGVYQALLDDVLNFLRPIGRSPDGRKVNTATRDLYKRVELTLNRHTARIEAVRRQTPEEFQRNVRDAFLYARDKRTECLDAFLGATLTREPADVKPQSDPLRPPVER